MKKTETLKKGPGRPKGSTSKVKPMQPMTKAVAKAGAKAPAKPASAARVVASRKNPGLLAARAVRSERAAHMDSVTALMATQRAQGITVADLAKIHHLSEKTVYSRLRKAPAGGRKVVIARAATSPTIEAPTGNEKQEIAYLRGRVDQLETFLSQFFSLGMKKLLRALAP